MRASIEDAGSYHYFLNGEPAAIEESWQRRQQAPGEWWVSSTRKAPGVAIAVEASVFGGLVTGFVVTWRGDGPKLRADYTLLANRIRVERSGIGATESLDIPLRNTGPTPLLFPLMRIFAGPLIAELLDRGSVGSVVVPGIADPGAPEMLLLPVVSERSARLVEHNAILKSEHSEFQCRRCEYLGAQYGPGAEFWLADDDSLLRYQWRQSPQRHWDVWLQRDGGQ